MPKGYMGKMPTLAIEGNKSFDCVAKGGSMESCKRVCGLVLGKELLILKSATKGSTKSFGRLEMVKKFRVLGV